MGSMGSSVFGLLPHAKPAQERIGVVAQPATGRQLVQLLGVAPTEDHVVGVEGVDHAFHRIGDVLLPLLLAQPLQPALAQVVLVGAFLNER